MSTFSHNLGYSQRYSSLFAICIHDRSSTDWSQFRASDLPKKIGHSTHTLEEDGHVRIDNRVFDSTVHIRPNTPYPLGSWKVRPQRLELSR